MHTFKGGMSGNAAFHKLPIMFASTGPGGPSLMIVLAKVKH